jgi:hypothetical protein
MNNRRDFDNQPAPPTVASPTVPTPQVQQTAWSEQDPYGGGGYSTYDQPQPGMYSERQPQPQYYDQAPAPQYNDQPPPVAAPEARRCRGTGSPACCSAPLPRPC